MKVCHISSQSPSPRRDAKQGRQVGAPSSLWRRRTIAICPSTTSPPVSHKAGPANRFASKCLAATSTLRRSGACRRSSHQPVPACRASWACSLRCAVAHHRRRQCWSPAEECRCCQWPRKARSQRHRSARIGEFHQSPNALSSRRASRSPRVLSQAGLISGARRNIATIQSRRFGP